MPERYTTSLCFQAAAFLLKRIFVKKIKKTVNSWWESMWLTDDNKKSWGTNSPVEYEDSLALAIHRWLQAAKCRKTREMSRTKTTTFSANWKTTTCTAVILMLHFCPPARFVSAPTNRFVSHSHIPGGPATEATGQVVSLLHGRLGWVIRQRSWDVGGPSRQRVHATGTIEAIRTPTVRRTEQEMNGNNWVCKYL